jgi:hypothetical protein
MVAGKGGYGDPVECPNGHPTGRQDPIYDAYIVGLPVATGRFRCEVCGLIYRPQARKPRG